MKGNNMNGFSEKTTGIAGVVFWLNPGDGGRLGPRLKVSNVKGKARFEQSDTFSVSIPRAADDVPVLVEGVCELSAVELKRVYAFVQNNARDLFHVWNAVVLLDEVTFTKV